MKQSFVLFVFVFSLLVVSVEMIEAQDTDYPPDDLSLVFTGIECSDFSVSPQQYPNAKHITNVIAGSYYFPVPIWETGSSWKNQSCFSYWDDQFQFWSYPDSFTSAGGGTDTGRGNVWSDSKGNLHFAWHQAGNPDGYEIFYTKAVLDTTTGIILYNVERPGIVVSETDDIEGTHPAMCLKDDNPYIVWIQDNVLYWNYSLNNGVTWIGADTAFFDTMLGSLVFPNIAPDPTSGDLWVATNYDANGDSSMDIVAFHYVSLSGIWEQEFAAFSPDSHPYALPAVSVDYSGKPGIIFQRNAATDGGMGGLVGGPAGPIGMLLFTQKVTGTWIPPETLQFAPDSQIETAGWPSVGITETDEIYVTFTQDSASAGHQVFYSKIIPDLGIFDIRRRIVSKDDSDSLLGGAFPHMTYNFPVTGPYAGPGISWCVVDINTADLYYRHMPLIESGIEEDKDKIKPSLVSLRISPNPFSTKTEITFSIGQSAEGIEIGIYDVCGRLVKNFSLTTTNSIIPTVITWDGKDNSGRDVPAGVYFISGRIGGIAINEKFVCVR